MSVQVPVRGPLNIPSQFVDSGFPRPFHRRPQTRRPSEDRRQWTVTATPRAVDPGVAKAVETTRSGRVRKACRLSKKEVLQKTVSEGPFLEGGQSDDSRTLGTRGPRCRGLPGRTGPRVGRGKSQSRPPLSLRRKVIRGVHSDVSSLVPKVCTRPRDPRTTVGQSV